MTLSFADLPEPSNSGRFTFTMEPKTTQFGFFTREEVVKMSVKQILNPHSYDALGHPVPDGLYDPTLGPTDRNQGACPTCGLDNTQCPGHLGHIELTVPVYNPLVFPTMYKVLMMKCFKCNSFRMSMQKTKILRTKLLLLEANLYEEASELDNLISKAGVKNGDGETSNVNAILVKYESHARDVFLKNQQVQAGKNSFQKRTGREEPFQMHIHCRSFWRELVAEFLAKQPKTCENCGEAACRLRKAGYAKIFRTLRHSSNVCEDALDHDEDDEEEVDTNLVLKSNEVFLHAAEVEAHFEKLWAVEKGIASRIWGSPGIGDDDLHGYHCFFLQTLAIPPSRFRPPAFMEGMTFDHPHTVALQSVIKFNDQLATVYTDKSTEDNEASRDTTVLQSSMELWVNLQESVNSYLDSSKAKGMNAPPGVRQALEKKEGLFRQNMMGKRVNYACRSVISPDPYIGTDEVGLPVIFATKLYYPEPVTSWNSAKLAQMVENGADQWPGAAFVEDEDGNLIDLSKRDERQRADIASSLQNVHTVQLTDARSARAGRFQPGEDDGLFKRQRNKQHAPLTLMRQKKVWRHVISGDIMLANRQPTLHKPSLMAHKVRVINNPAMQTIRLHYANCNSYNADFDGDEINLHLPQSELCRAEAYEVAYTNHQYCSTTDGSPLRGLIQDHVDMGVMLTRLGNFLSKEEYTQMVYAACAAMNSRSPHIKMVPPAVLKPRAMWTGKQVITTLIMHLIGTDDPEQLLSMGPRKSKIPAAAWKDYSGAKRPSDKFLAFAGDEAGPLGETLVIFRQGRLCTGVLDKAQFGASKHGLVHSVYELYGPNAAGELLSAFGRLFTFCSQKWGHTCAIEDLVLTRTAEEGRTENIRSSIEQGLAVSAKFVGAKRTISNELLAQLLHDKIRVHNNGEDAEAILDSEMQVATSKVQSKIIGDCLPKGQRKPFPDNCFSLMIYSGAKGSLVNHSQVSCALGQQALEGRRVPRTIAGKSLPCFSSFDPTPRAGGYVSDRFLTGVRPQEYYFHCMAGREGLIDTAVKTARSGYLQRCLVKHLENLSVHYDRTVRVSDGSCIQFLYGEDGLDAVNTSYLQGCDDTLGFLYSNYKALAAKLQVGSEHGQMDLSGAGIDILKAPKLYADIAKTKAKSAKLGRDIAIFSGAYGLARRPKRQTTSSFAETSLLPGLRKVKITKTHKKDNSVDLVFIEDNHIIKRYPLMCDDRRLLFATMPDPVMSQLVPDSHLGAICEKLQLQLDRYVETNPHGIIKSPDDALTLQQLVWVKYLRSMVAPGENVGVIAAQGIGEPSTQMTLNTFHLAGHGAGNVTLGIPRMRELLMTASQTQKTPSMILPLKPNVTKAQAEDIKSSMYKLHLSELLHTASGGIKVTERLGRESLRSGALEFGSVASEASAMNKGEGTWVRQYEIRLVLQPLKAIKKQFNLNLGEVGHLVGKNFLPILMRMVKKELSRGGNVLKRVTVKGTKDEEDDDSNDDQPVEEPTENNDNDKNPKAKEIDGYDDDDDSDESDAAQSAESEDESEDPLASLHKIKDTRKSMPDSWAHVEVPDIVRVAQCWDGCFTSPAVGSEPASIIVRLRFPASSKKLLVVGLAEQAAEQAVLKHTKDIENAYVVEAKDGSLSIATAGTNFHAAFELADDVEINKIDANNVGAFLKTYGVEAARAAIVKEVGGVFGAYGIGVDPRHLGLVADYMTFEGGYRALNRGGISSCPSPFVRVTFETSAAFLTQSALQGEIDNLKSVSARLCLGQLLQSGTGAFDLVVPNTAKSTVRNTPSYSMKTKEKMKTNL